jgi:hypothetical protein
LYEFYLWLNIKVSISVISGEVKRSAMCKSDFEAFENMENSIVQTAKVSSLYFTYYYVEIWVIVSFSISE